MKSSKVSGEDEQVLSDRKRGRVGHRAMTLEGTNVKLMSLPGCAIVHDECRNKMREKIKSNEQISDIITTD